MGSVAAYYDALFTQPITGVALDSVPTATPVYLKASTTSYKIYIDSLTGMKPDSVSQDRKIAKFLMQDNTTIKAWFAQAPLYKLSLSNNAGGSVALFSDTLCTIPFPYHLDSILPDTKIFFKATAIKGKAISQWTNIDAQSEDASIAVLTIKANTAVKAIFDNTYTLTLSDNPAGKLYAWLDAAHTKPIPDLTDILNGKNIYIAAVPDFGNFARSIQGCDNTATDQLSGTLAISSNRTITATFEGVEISTEIIYEIFADHAIVIGYKGTNPNIRVPDTYLGLPVTEIGSGSNNANVNGGRSLAQNPYIGTMVLPTTGITKINDNAFYGCTNLTAINIPTTATIIGNYAFYNCKITGSFAIPNNITSIGSYAFYNNPFTAFTIGSGVRTIGSNALASCTNLSSITIPASVTDIGTGLLQNCTALRNVTVPVIGNVNKNMLSGCSNINLTFAGGGNTIAGYAFYSTNVLSSVTIPSNVSTISDYAFRQCPITTLTISNTGNPLSIGANSFAENRLTTLTLPDRVTSIGGYAFLQNDCSNTLKTIYIGSSSATLINSIDGGAFFTFQSLSTVYIYATTPPTLIHPLLGSINGLNPTFYVPKASINAYKTQYASQTVESYNGNCDSHTTVSTPLSDHIFGF